MNNLNGIIFLFKIEVSQIDSEIQSWINSLTLIG